MIYFLILPLSRVKTEALPNLGYLTPETEQVQEQFSSILTNSNIIGKSLTKKLISSLYGTACTSLIFSPKVWGQNNWLTINIVGKKTYDNPPQKKVEITFGSSNRFSDITEAELEKYKFALYLYRKSGDDLMSLKEPFKDKNFYQYSLEIDPDDIDRSPNQDFKETVRRNYIDEASSSDGTYFLLGFREDLLLIYDY